MAVTVKNALGILKGVDNASMTSAFGPRTYTIGGKKVSDVHKGIDLKPVVDVMCPESGKVIAVVADIKASQTPYIIANSVKSLYTGNYVKVQFGELVGLFAHLAEGTVAVKVGQMLKKGDKLGTVGSTGYSTGAHLHFALYKNNVPVDPLPYLIGQKAIVPFQVKDVADIQVFPTLKVLVDGLRYRDSANGNILGYLTKGKEYPFLGLTVQVGGYAWAQIVVDNSIAYVAKTDEYNSVNNPMDQALTPPITLSGQINGKDYIVEFKVKP